MALATTALAQEIGRALVELLRDAPAAQRLWVRPTGDTVDVWVLTAPLDVHQERAFYDVIPLLHDRFADAAFRFHAINPRDFPDADPL